MTKPAWFKWITIGIFLTLLALAGYYSFNTGHYVGITSPFEGAGSFSPTSPGEQTDPAGESDPGESAAPGTDPGTGGGPAPVEVPEAQWAGSERVTILIMGLDYRDWEAGSDAPRTDTMILLTIDPLSNTAGMLTIPRDLWVQIPGFQFDRINTAYRSGEVYDLPGGGPALAVETVEQLMGVEIDYYAQIDFNVFVRLIDEIGGVKIDVAEPVEVDLIGPEPPKVIQPGRYTMPGDVALAYARARSTEGGDFDRGLRQQQVILAVRDRILSFDLVPILLAKSGILYNELATGVKTNLSLEEAINLGLLALDVPVENIRRGAIGSEQIIFYTTPSGDQVLKPLPDQIRILRDFVFGTAGLTSPLAGLTPEERVAAEAATISLLNGTFVEGLAGRTAEFLLGAGITVPAENLGNAAQNYVFTQIIDHTGNPYTVQMLVELLGIQPHLIYLRYDPNSPVDIVINLGDDWAGQAP
jgi:LCP family protein required for cell wall assembly